MKSGIFVIGIGIIVISIIIYLVKNFKDFLNFFDKIKKYKITTIIYKVLMIVVIFGMIYSIYYFILKVKTSIEFYQFAKENEAINDYNDNKIFEEAKFYKEAINKNYDNQKSQEPYIPDGYSYVEGEWNTGFVIQDETGNQYVWVPCSNKENSGVELLERKNFSKMAFISKDVCINENCEEFINSSLENGGFYVSRFEIGKENNLPVSKKGVEVWANITRKQATELASKINKNQNLHYELINGYAYDTTISWIKNSNEIEIDKREYQKTVFTGRNEYNNIYDFIDNVFEITSESSYGNVIIRGFLLDDEESLNNEIFKNFDYENESFDRISIREEDNYYTLEHTMGFRTVLYK